MLPNFLICGIEKGGTSSLYHYLKAHPEVFMSEKKEINFFSFNYSEGIGWYEDHFKGDGVAEAKARGEASPLYMTYPEVARRIARTLPEAKLLFVLRDPAERAYSDYWFNINRGIQYPQESFSTVIRKPTGYLRYIRKGYYADQIEAFLPHFRRDQLHFVITEALRRDTPGELRRCFRFLGVSDHEPEIRKRHNKAQLPRNGASALALNVVLPVQKAIYPMLPGRVEGRVKELVRSTFFAAKEKPPMPEADRAFLREIYQEPNARLAELIEADVSSWT